MSRTPRAIALGAIVVLSVGACGRSQDPSASETAKASSTSSVVVRSFMFEPGTVEVKAGTTVTWTNEDDIAHTVTSGTPGEGGVPGVSEEAAPKPDGLFDEPLEGDDETASVTFDEAGRYPYFCSIHDGMTGVVGVS